MPEDFAQPSNTEQGPYYVMPSERLQELLERAREGEDVGALMADQYAEGSKEYVPPWSCISCEQPIKDDGVCSEGCPYSGKRAMA